MTLEQLTASLREQGINPDGYGERIGETREEHVARILGANFDPLDFIPCQDMNREEIDLGPIQ